ncbi:MBL fold metallo-hydrolase [Natronorarus salvus]|uniref:MBL fold metallo-hydrolase n=1 Tax=Natronorarus salvus TaxID=3117733 RepID=UPI002F25F207
MDPDSMEFPSSDAPVETVSPGRLKERIDLGEDVTLLDVRMESEYEEWRIDGESVKNVNVPYFEFLDEEIDEDVLARIPDDRELTVLCAKGGASEFVAAALAERGYDVDHLEEGMNGWARVYEAHEVTGYDGAGTLVQYQRPSSGCLGYLLFDGSEAAVFDPLRAFTDRYLADAEEFGVELTYAFDTHVHADHVSGLRELAAEGVEAVLPEAAGDRGVTYTDELTLTTDGDTFAVGDATIETVFTPGHTSGMSSYLIDDAFLATGDTLFVENVARPDLEEDDDGAPEAARTLYESLQERVLTLPDDTLVGGAHASDAAVPAADGTYTARIVDLKGRMDALSMDDDEFVELVLSEMPPRPANYEEIIATNLGRRETDDEEAFTLELGPNNCAASRETLTSD